MEIFKKCFVVFKCSLLSIFFILAIRARYKKLGHFDFVSFMFCVNIIVLIGLLSFEFGIHYIYAYLLMIFAANYVNFIGFNMLVRRLPTPEGAMLRRKTNCFFIIMNILYFTAVGLIFVPAFGPMCTASKLYPFIFTYVESLLVLNGLYHHYLHYKKYWLKWEDSPEV